MERLTSPAQRKTGHAARWPMKMGGMGAKEQQRFDTVGFTGTPSESSFGTPSPRSGMLAALQQMSAIPVAAASAAADRNVGFTSIPAGSFTRKKAVIPEVKKCRSGGGNRQKWIRQGGEPARLVDPRNS